MIERVGVRELKANLSAVLRRVQEEGATLDVTDHGQPVARIIPWRPRGIERLQADGHLHPAPDAGLPWPDLVPIRPGEMSGSEALAELRADER